MSWFRKKDNDDLFAFEEKKEAQDTFWNHLLLGIFIVLAIIIGGIIAQAAF